MISAIVGCPTIRRSTRPPKAAAVDAVAPPATATAPASPSPSAWTPAATRREPSMSHSPRAKLITPEALYTMTKARAASAYTVPASAPSTTSATRKTMGACRP